MIEEFEMYKPTLTEEQVIEYLLSWKHKGYHVLKGRPIIKNGWSVEFGGDVWIGICPDDYPTSKGYWRIVYAAGFLRGHCGTMEELRSKFETLAKQFGIRAGSHPTQHHTSVEQPLSVWVQLKSMIASSKIEAIYDPHIRNKALNNLLDLQSLGVCFSENLRILTTNKHGVTENFIDKFNKQLNLNSKWKINLHNSHPRLLLLSDHRCLSPDFSLNDE